ncbi:hypothetical protein G6O69_15610 [Pseudenhygromyxa sp. WMMC2535]|uniref:hypothetical protein n=1 Tax=Pseudenhygromyxa sp. WMMC2535 TaxID=2712867 RepID=UPI001554936A|nr:hypothetical protein [Pseudenhygromyxa sp. WMMC2535]NVB39270.1 hypothetical protein [Pseudenhygromyxa sp. WMMC2535]
MFQFGSAAKASPEFVPDEDAREWIAAGLVDLAGKLGEPARQPRLLTDPADLKLGRAASPWDLDSLFDMICGVQEFVGQGEVEMTLLEVDARSAGPQLQDGYESLGDANGKLLHTFRGPEEYLMLFAPAAFKVRELLLASVARELGRIALDRVGERPALEDGDPRQALLEWEADAEIAAVLLGMGVWVANGAYVYENACCGGGCGVDLRSIRAGLSMPEACYALSIDSQRKGIRRRQVLKQLAPTQKAATKRCWSHLGSALPPALAAAEPAVLGQLRA